MIRGFGTAVLLAVVLAACAAPRGSAQIDRSPAAVGPSPPAPTLLTPRPSPAVAAPSVSPWTSSVKALAWHRLGVIRASHIDGLIGFAKGFVALEGSAGSVWHSPDGGSWERVKLPIDPALRASADANGMLGRVIATNGREVLVVGGYSHAPCEPPSGDTGGGPECAISPIAWISADGRSWRRLVPGEVGDGEFVAAWPVATGGWNAAVSAWSGEALGGDELWRSEDGITWAPGPTPPAPWEGYEHAPLGVADGSGQYLLAAGERGGPGTTLAAMTDGGSWRLLDGFAGEGAEVMAGVAPAVGGTRWVLGGQSGCHVGGEGDDGCDGGPTVWSSIDGAAWTATRLRTGPGVPGADPPVAVSAVASLALSERGYVAVGADGSWSEGARHETWVSDDGVAWTLLPQASRPRFDYGPGRVANGPRGVIGISGSAADKEQVAWQLR
jgi:hypothetical protein